MIEEEYKREIKIGDEVFIARKDLTYSMWVISKGNYTYPGSYTSLPKAIIGANNLVNSKPKKVK